MRPPWRGRPLRPRTPWPGAAAEDGALPDLREADPRLHARLSALFDEGWETWSRFDTDVRQHTWHPFVPADYEVVLGTLLALRQPGRRFLEWGSAYGVITIMADLLGFEAYGIELDPSLVRVARDLATRHGSGARFTVGSFLPEGYEWKPRSGDGRLGTVGEGTAAYAELGHPLEDFDVVFAFPWTGEEAMMRDVMRRYGGARALLVLYGAVEGVRLYDGDRPVPR